MIAPILEKLICTFLRVFFGKLNGRSSNFSREKTWIDALFSPSTNTICHRQDSVTVVGGVFATSVNLIIVWNDDRLALKVGAGVVGRSYGADHCGSEGSCQ